MSNTDSRTSSGFCGSQIWDHDLTENTTNPDLTHCFQKTVLLWVPCFYLALITPFYIRNLLRRKDSVVPWNWLNVLKMALCAAIAACMLVEVGQGIKELTTHAPVPHENLISPLIVLISMVMCIFIICSERLHGVRASGFLAIFWTLLTVFGIVTFRSHIRTILLAEGEDLKVDVFRIVIFYIYYLVVVVQFVLSMFLVDKAPASWSPTGSNPCPEMQSSVASRMTFWWLTGLIVQGYKRPLDMTDIYTLNKRETAEYIHPRMACNIEREMRKQQCGKFRNKELCKKYIAKCKREAADPSKGDEKVLFNEPVVSIQDGNRKLPSFFKIVWMTFYSTFLASFVYKLINDILTFVSPQILKLMIQFVGDSSKPAWKGYVYAVAILLVTCTQTLVLSQYFYHCLNLGMWTRTGVIAAIYRKALKLTNTARKSSTVGEIVNLMSVDAQKFVQLGLFFHMVWSSPFQIAVCMFFLWQLLGPSVLAGLGVLILLIPINLLTANKVKQFQTKQMKLKDDRVKLVNEVLNGMKVLKLYAWEKPFEDRIQQLRNEELRVLKYAAYLNAIVSFTWTLAPFLVSLTTFAVFVMVSDDNILDAEKAFVSLSLFNILRFPIAMLPQVIGTLIQVRVSLKRLDYYMGHDELDDSIVIKDSASAYSVSIDDGTFSWDKDSDATLRNLNVKIDKGSLVAVVGRVGSGKTSLIATVLGEMEKISGSVTINGSLAYVAQQAWIQNATLRDNILFSKDFDAVAYEKIIEACALKTDLDMLSAGDQTEIGEKGINLSGGQKQRVSVARAVYADADIYLLDDPLSAVDSHVSKHMFDEVLGPNGALANKTRIIVTHGVRFLPLCDQIIVLADGEISECGSYNQLIRNNQAFAEFLKNYLIEGEEEPDVDSDEVSLKEDVLSHLECIMCDEEKVELKKKKVPTATLR